MTITALARRLGVQPQTIHRWLRLGWPVPREGSGIADLATYPPRPRARVVRTRQMLEEYRRGKG